MAAIMLFEILSEYTGIRLPWGILTGVRPIKLLHNLVRELGTDGADKYFREKLLVTEQKTKLALTTEKMSVKFLNFQSLIHSAFIYQCRFARQDALIVHLFLSR